MKNNWNIRYPKGLIPSNAHNSQFEFLYGMDDETRFLKNLATFPNDWVYRNKKINYSYNQYGHRCNNISELQDDYILFLGCSHSEGIGLTLEDTYPYLVAKSLKKTYYNLSVAGSGSDVACHNLMMFLSLMKNKKPKYIVFQFSGFFRFSLIDHNYNLSLFHPKSSDHKLVYKNLLDLNLLDSIESTNIFLHYAATEFLINYDDSIKIVYLIDPLRKNDELFINLPDNFIVTPLNFKGRDYARDNSHYGIYEHKLQAEEILKLLV